MVDPANEAVGKDQVRKYGQALKLRYRHSIMEAPILILRELIDAFLSRFTQKRAVESVPESVKIILKMQRYAATQYLGAPISRTTPTAAVFRLMAESAVGNRLTGSGRVAPARKNIALPRARPLDLEKSKDPAKEGRN